MALKVSSWRHGAERYRYPVFVLTLIGLVSCSGSGHETRFELPNCPETAGSHEMALRVSAVRDRAVVIDFVDGSSTRPSGLEVQLECLPPGRKQSTATILYYGEPKIGARSLCVGDRLTLRLPQSRADLWFLDDFEVVEIGATGLGRDPAGGCKLSP